MWDLWWVTSHYGLTFFLFCVIDQANVTVVSVRLLVLPLEMTLFTIITRRKVCDWAGCVWLAVSTTIVIHYVCLFMYLKLSYTVHVTCGIGVSDWHNWNTQMLCEIWLMVVKGSYFLNHQSTVKLSLCTLWRQGNSRVTASPIFNLSPRWRWMVNFMPQLLYLCRKNPQYPLNKRLGGS